ncbi:MAG: CIA30 family protein [Pseudomonadota bacterium]
MTRIRVWTTISLLTLLATAALGVVQASAQSWAQSEAQAMNVIEAFDAGAEARWDYVQDGVMGGVSQGQAALEDGAIRLTGTVSTDNNGGFIQVRQRLIDGWPADVEGLNLRVRGNGERYYVFLRTTSAQRPWHSYRASFTANAEWQDITLPLSAFEASQGSLPARFSADEIRSIGLVAYGRDHNADLSVSRIALY